MRKLKAVILLLMLTLTLSACNLPGLGADAKGNDIVIVGGSHSERQILAEITLQMVNHYLPEQRTDLINNLGSGILVHQAITGGDANASGGNYTGTSLTGELKQEAIKDPQEALEVVVTGFYNQFDMLWFPGYGFENSYAFMVTNDFAKENNISKVSDLEPLADGLRVGADTSWIEREGDGYDDFKETYQFDFLRVYPMQIGLVYDAVAVNEMDVVVGYSTDGRIQANDLVVLEDDLQVFPPYDASPTATLDVLTAHPELLDIFLKLEATISNETMQGLNRKSDEDKIEPQVVAREFLEENNYFEDKAVIPLDDRDLYKDLMIDLNKRISEGK